MPFKSTKQVRKCFAMKRRNPRSSWDCKKWLKKYGQPKKKR